MIFLEFLIFPLFFRISYILEQTSRRTGLFISGIFHVIDVDGSAKVGTEQRQVQPHTSYW